MIPAARDIDSRGCGTPGPPPSSLPGFDPAMHGVVRFAPSEWLRRMDARVTATGLRPYGSKTPEGRPGQDEGVRAGVGQDEKETCTKESEAPGIRP